MYKVRFKQTITQANSDPLLSTAHHNVANFWKW